MGDLLDAIQVPRVIEGINGGGESSVEAEDAVRDHGRHGEVIEGVSEVLPNIGISVFPQAFVVESIT